MTSGRVSAGAESWIYSPNHIAASTQTTATTTAPVSGFATSPVTDGSAVTLTEGDLKSALQQAWSSGGEVDTILCGAALYNRISTFTGLATRFRDVQSRAQAQIIGAALINGFAQVQKRLQAQLDAEPQDQGCRQKDRTEKHQ